MKTTPCLHIWSVSVVQCAGTSNCHGPWALALPPLEPVWSGQDSERTEVGRGWGGMTLQGRVCGLRRLGPQT